MESDTRHCIPLPSAPAAAAAAHTQALQVALEIDTEAARIHPTRMEVAAAGTKPLDQSLELVP